MPTHSRTPNQTDIHIGQQIRKRRQQLNMSQTILGERLGVTFQQVQKYEKGTNRVGGGRLAQIAAVLGASITYFYEGAAPAGGASPGGDAIRLADRREAAAHSADGMALIEALAKVRSPKMRKAMVTVVKAMAAAG